jgi:hypothetical protein
MTGDPKPPYSLLYSNDPAAAAWRAKQADVDSDIEGLSHDREADRMIAGMDARGVDPRQQIERLKRYFKVSHGHNSSDEG